MIFPDIFYSTIFNQYMFLLRPVTIDFCQNKFYLVTQSYLIHLQYTLSLTFIFLTSMIPLHCPMNSSKLKHIFDDIYKLLVFLLKKSKVDENCLPFNRLSFLTCLMANYISGKGNSTRGSICAQFKFIFCNVCICSLQVECRCKFFITLDIWSSIMVYCR